ncbi:MAG: hypothetical protein NTX45_13140 [Proteobacteria bacterium]|nr:hypothetical protein [Pseudomonadota bacterium]
MSGLICRILSPVDISNVGRWKYPNMTNRKSIDWFPSSDLGTHIVQAPASSGSMSFKYLIPKLELGNEQTLRIETVKITNNERIEKHEIIFISCLVFRVLISCCNSSSIQVHLNTIQLFLDSAK